MWSVGEVRYNPVGDEWKDLWIIRFLLMNPRFQLFLQANISLEVTVIL